MSADNLSQAPAGPAAAVQWLRQHAPHIALVIGATGVAALLGYGLTLSLLPLLGGQAELVGAVIGAVVTVIGLPMALWMRVPQQAYLKLLRQRGVADERAYAPAASRAQAGATVTPLRPLRPVTGDAATVASGASAGASGSAASAASGLASPAQDLAAAAAALTRQAEQLLAQRRQQAAAGGMPPVDRRAPANDFQPLAFGPDEADSLPGIAAHGAGQDGGRSIIQAGPAPAQLPGGRRDTDLPLPSLPGDLSPDLAEGMARLDELARPVGQLPSPMAEGIADAQRSVRDALTGAYTQQHFVAAADREWSRLRRHGEDAALLMIDIDRFKGINERYGTGCGDALLVEITRQVSGTLRQYDLLSRFGGGVLVVYLPHTDPIGALDVAERIRERVATLRIHWEQHTVRTTVSVGVAGIGASHGALDEVIADAGTALRDAKAAGRNCVRAAPIPPRRSTDPFPVRSQGPLDPL